MVTGAADGSTIDLAALLRRAAELLWTDPAQAEAIARQVIAIETGDDAMTVLGAALSGQGAYEAALDILEPLVARRKESWAARFELARVLVALGQSRGAVKPLTEALALNPELSAGWRLLGDIRLFSGQFSAAQSAYDGQLRSEIGDPRLQAVMRALAEGQLGEAERHLESILTADPTAISAVHLLAEVLARQGRLADAERLLSECLRRAPDHAPARRTLALVLYAAGQHARALVQLDQILARDPDDRRCRIIKAAALTELGEHAAAADIGRALLEVFPDQPRGWLVHGHSLRTLGRTEEAVAAFRRCLDLDPDCGEAYWSLANLKTYRFPPSATVDMNARLGRSDLGVEDRIHLHFALGRAHEDAGRWGEAFDQYSRGNAIERGRGRYDADRTSAFVRRSKTLFTADFFTARVEPAREGPTPIFIVGLPRSGSTLVDQILASHPAVEGVGELRDIQTVADWIGGPRAGGLALDYLDRVAALGPDIRAGLGRDYLEKSRARRLLDRPYFADKAPWNFMHIGLIRLILPGARIIDVRRHPLGCCLSLFKQHFARGWSFSNDLVDAGRYYADYVDLMMHYDAVLPGAVHRMIYEDLVQDTPAEVRRLLDWLGLPFDPACLRFFENPRAVATPSSEQVRQPIFTDGLDHWRSFEPWLQPLKDALGPVLESWPHRRPI